MYFCFDMVPEKNAFSGCNVEIAKAFKGVLICRGDTEQAFVLLYESQNIWMQMSLISRSAEKAHDS